MRRPTSSRWKSWFSAALVGVVVALPTLVSAAAVPCFGVPRRTPNGLLENAAGVAVEVRNSSTQGVVASTVSDNDGNWCFACPSGVTEFDVTYGLCVGGRSPNRTCSLVRPCNQGTCGKSVTHQPLCGGTGSGPGGSGDVVGPVSATTNTLPKYANTSGKLLATTTIAIDAQNRITLPDQDPGNPNYLRIYRNTVARTCAANGLANTLTLIDTTGSGNRFCVCDGTTQLFCAPGTGASVAGADTALIGTAADTGTWQAMPDCPDSAGKHLNWVRRCQGGTNNQAACTNDTACPSAFCAGRFECGTL